MILWGAKSKLTMALVLLGTWLMLMTVPLLASTGSTDQPVQLYMNEEQLYSDVEPVIINGRTLVPLRVISEASGAEVDWDDNSKTVIVSSQGEAGENLQITIGIGSETAAILEGGLVRQSILDVPAQIIDSRTMVPVRFLCETLGLSVSWDGDKRIIYLSRASDNSMSIQVAPEEVKYENEWIDVNLQIPVVSGLNDTVLQEDLNNSLEDDVLQFKNSLEAEAQEYYQDSRDGELHFWPYAAYTSYRVAYNNNNILSISMDYYQYTGGAHGYTSRIPYNYDLLSGEEIKLSDLFAASFDYRSVLNQEISRQMQENPEMYFEDDIVAFPGVKEDHSYYLEADGLVIYFELYEIAPYAAGIPEFKVPYTLLQKGMKHSL